MYLHSALPPFLLPLLPPSYTGTFAHTNLHLTLCMFHPESQLVLCARLCPATASGHTPLAFLLNPFSGLVSVPPPGTAAVPPPFTGQGVGPDAVRGGILSDEMGLGALTVG